jgi:transglutaminase-like putative cysteine protease
MKIERLLQVNIAALTVVGTLLLGLGQNNPMLPALSLFAAVTSIYLTDVLGWFRLNRVVANLAALGALFISMREFDIFGGNSSSQLRAIANLLVYLQFVLLYQEKNQRVYWQLGVLSLLQVVVAAALDLKIGLGLLLLVYMFTALSAMALLFVYSQVEHVQNHRAEEGENGTSLEAWSPSGLPRAVRNCSERQIQSSLLGWRFLGRLAGIGVATWVLALTVFLATPRLGNAVWRGTHYGGPRSTGFSRDIRLGQMSQILQNESTAMTVKILDRAGAPILLDHPPYFRGTALSHYKADREGGSWSQSQLLTTWRFIELRRPPDEEWVETRFSLESSSSEVLFSIAPCYRSDATRLNVRYDLLDEQVVRAMVNPLRPQHEAIQYSLATTGIRNGRQVEVWPSRRGHGLVEDRASEQEIDQMREWDRLQFRETAGLARQILQENGTSPRKRYEASKALEAYFKRPGLFTYTLDPTGIPPRPPEVDPIEHFLLAHRRGHCEYFASALVMLLRSQGIPARVVVGYHGGDYNSIGKFYLVRQRDAHAWVEVYLEPQHLPPLLRGELPAEATGAWLRLDPTPEAEDTMAPGALAPLADTADYLESLWNDYVLGLNFDRQRDAIYGPIVRGYRAVRAKVQPIARALVQRPGSTRAAFWKFAGMSVVLVAACILLVWTIWRSWRSRGEGSRWGGWVAGRWRGLQRRRGPEAAALSSRADFYRRFEKLLARRRYRRLTTQTQREFAAEVASLTGAAPLLERVVAAYYRVRFGGRPLDSDEAAAIEKALEELGQTLARRRA